MMLKRLPVLVLVLLVGFLSSAALADEPIRVQLPVKAATVTLLNGLPDGEEGVRIGNTPTFREESLTPADGSVRIDLAGDPVFILEGDVTAAPRRRPVFLLGTGPACSEPSRIRLEPV